jgi:hypothetical protein
MTVVDLRSLEGQRVSLALGDGSRIDDCQLVSAPRGQSDRVWLCVGGQDRFVALDDIADAWPARR